MASPGGPSRTPLTSLTAPLDFSAFAKAGSHATASRYAHRAAPPELASRRRAEAGRPSPRGRREHRSPHRGLTVTSERHSAYVPAGPRHGSLTASLHLKVDRSPCQQQARAAVLPISQLTCKNSRLTATRRCSITEDLAREYLNAGPLVPR